METQKMDEIIWNYLDGIASEDEVSLLEQKLATDPVWQMKLKELKDLHLQLQTNFETEAPSLRFSKNVMEQISLLQPAPATIKYINRWIIRGIAAFFLLTISGLLIYGIAQTNWSTNEASTIIPKLTIPNIEKYFTSTTINILIMIIIVISLVLIDHLLRKKKTLLVEDGITKK